MNTPENAVTAKVEIPRPQRNGFGPLPENWNEQVKAYNEQELAKVQGIYTYHDTGIGFRFDQPGHTVTVIKFHYTDNDAFNWEEITLKQSVEWVGRMTWTSVEFEDCLSFDDEGLIQWLRMIENEL